MSHPATCATGKQILFRRSCASNAPGLPQQGAYRGGVADWRCDHLSTCTCPPPLFASAPVSSTSSAFSPAQCLPGYKSTTGGGLRSPLRKIPLAVNVLSPACSSTAHLQQQIPPRTEPAHHPRAQCTTFASRTHIAYPPNLERADCCKVCAAGRPPRLLFRP